MPRAVGLGGAGRRAARCYAFRVALRVRRHKRERREQIEQWSVRPGTKPKREKPARAAHVVIREAAARRLAYDGVSQLVADGIHEQL